MKLINPYENVDFGRYIKVPAISHEHINNEKTLQSAYDRGIRFFAGVWYMPSVAHYPLKESQYSYKDYLYYDTTHPDTIDFTEIEYTYNSAKEARESVDFSLVKRKGVIVRYSMDGETFLYTKLVSDEWSVEDSDWKDVTEEDVDSELETYDAVYSSTIPTYIDENGVEQSTDNLVQIPNQEHTYIAYENGYANQHLNALGNMFTQHGIYTRKGLRRDFRLAHMMYKLKDMREVFEANSVYKGKNFYTINHCNSVYATNRVIEEFGEFHGFELFNQGYSKGWNQEFRDTYDELLKNGLRLYGVAVPDWHGDYKPLWTYCTDEERIEWTNKYNSLSSEEQAQFGSAKEYYEAVGAEVNRDRGCNVLLMDENYSSLPTNCFPNEDYIYSKAEAGLDAYHAGRYYMSAWNSQTITSFEVDDNRIKLSVTGSPAKFKFVTNLRKEEVENGSDVYIQEGETYLRFEAYYDDGEFIFTNPIWIEDNEIKVKDDTSKRLLLLLS